MANEPPKTGQTKAIGAGRGLVYITAAKIYFMLGASALGIILTHLLHAVELYGEWNIVLQSVSAPNNVIVTGTIQAVSKFSSRGPEYVEGVKRAALRLHLVFGVSVALGFALLAPWIAREVWHDPRLVTPLRIASLVVLCYSFYSVFVGAANGAREFHKQAGLDVTFTTLRTVLVCTAALLFQSAAAAIGAFAAAAGTVLVISIAVVGWRPMGQTAGQKTSTGELWRFIAPVSLYLLVLNALMFLDTWIMKALVQQAAAAAGQADPARLASQATGLYGMAQAIARIPYQAILSVTFVIFPLVSQSTFAHDLERTRGYIDKAIRLSLLIVLALATAVAARPEALLYLAKREYLAAAAPLSVLVFGYVFFSLFSIAGTILNGAGRTRATMLIGGATLVVQAATIYGAMRWAQATGRDPLVWAAAGTTAGMGMGFVLSLVWLQRSFGASLRGSTVVRAALAAGAAIGLGRLVPVGRVLGPSPGVVKALAVTVPVAAMAVVIYVAVLFASRELSRRELSGLLRRGADKGPGPSPPPAA